MSRIKWSEMLQIFAAGFAMVLLLWIMILIAGGSKLSQADENRKKADEISASMQSVEAGSGAYESLLKQKDGLIEEADALTREYWSNSLFALIPLPIVLIFCVGKAADDIVKA